MPAHRVDAGGAPARHRYERQDLSWLHQGKRAERENRERAAEAAPVLGRLPVLTEGVRQAGRTSPKRGCPRHPGPERSVAAVPLAVSDETFDRMAESTSDGFVREDDRGP